MGAYETWLETKRLLSDSVTDAQDKYYEQVLAVLQPEALRNYIQQHAGLDVYEEPITYTEEQVQEFLAGLDDLRAPSSKELDQMRNQMRNAADEALTAMLRLNWTGDHTYGEAVEDAQLVLNEVLHSRPFPNLERFRCPSIRAYRHGQVQEIRCKLQLPHDGQHSWAAEGSEGSEGNLIGPLRWTDEQSVNPPKPYDEEPNETWARCRSVWAGRLCERSEGHEGAHQEGNASWPESLADGTLRNPEPVPPQPLKVDLDAEELSGHPVRSDDGPCTMLHPDQLLKDRKCARAKRHTGMHRTEEGRRWPSGV